MTELLPCPFCGGEPKLYQRGGAAGAKCTCNKTAFVHTYGKTKDDAAKAWNTRTPPEGFVLVPVAKLIDVIIRSDFHSQRGINDLCYQESHRQNSIDLKAMLETVKEEDHD